MDKESKVFLEHGKDEQDEDGEEKRQVVERNKRQQVAARQPVNRSIQGVFLQNYGRSVLEHQRNRELNFRLNVDHLQQQRGGKSSLVERWREKSIRWIVQIRKQFKLSRDVIYRTVKILDICLSNASIDLHSPRASLLVMVSLRMASKFDSRTTESLTPSFVESQNFFGAKDFNLMELKLLKLLSFDVSFPTSYNFLTMFAVHFELSRCMLLTAQYVLELSLFDHSLVGMLESQMATAAVVFTLRIYGHQWLDTYAHFTGYAIADLQKCLDVMAHRVVKPGPYASGIRNEYADEKHSSVSLVCYARLHQIRQPTQRSSFQLKTSSV